MSKSNSRMNIQSNYDFQTYNSNKHFFNYIIDDGTDGIKEEDIKNALVGYTGENYKQINQYLRKGEYHMNPFDGIASIFLLGIPIMLYKAHLLTIKSIYYGLSERIKVKELDNISQGTIVYKGVNKKPPSCWKVGDSFYFPEFVSTSLDLNVAKEFGDYIFVIKLNGKGFKGVERLSIYPNEKEVLINAYSKFKITKIDGKYYHFNLLDN